MITIVIGALVADLNSQQISARFYEVIDAIQHTNNEWSNNKQVLIVLTSHDLLGNTGESTGFHLAELTRPYYVLQAAGAAITLASVQGGQAPIDPGSEDYADPDNQRFRDDKHAQAALANTKAVESLQAGDYAAIYFPGGHGGMWDLPDNSDVQGLIRAIYQAGGVVAAVCHGPAALLNATLSDGTYLVANKQISVFTDAEEVAAGKADSVPFLLAKMLCERGAKHKKADNFKASVSVDGRLITGQNPAFARGVGEAICAQLR